MRRLLAIALPLAAAAALAGSVLAALPARSGTYVWRGGPESSVQLTLTARGALTAAFRCYFDPVLETFGQEYATVAVARDGRFSAAGRARDWAWRLRGRFVTPARAIGTLRVPRTCYGGRTYRFAATRCRSANACSFVVPIRPSASVPLQLDWSFTGDAIVGRPVQFEAFLEPRAALVTRYEWDFGVPGATFTSTSPRPGAPASRIARYTYAREGEYQVRVTATVRGGRTATFADEISIGPVEEPPPP